MKNFLKSCLLAGAVLCFGIQASAQFNIAGGMAFNKYSGSGYYTGLPYNKMHSGIQMRIGYDAPNSGYFINAGINYSPSIGKLSAYLDNENPESYIQLQRTTNNLFVHWGKSFLAPQNDFHFRLICGVSFDMINHSFKFGDSVSIADQKLFKDTSMIGEKIDFGAGVDFRIGDGKLYAEYIMSLAANKKNGQDYYNPAVNHYGVILGYIFYIKGRKSIRW